MSKIAYMTQDIYDQLMDKLDHMRTKGREEIAEAIATARDKGDLSENAEYDAAKNAQGMHELKINELEKQLAIAKVIKPEDLDTSHVSVLTNVTIKNNKTNKEVTYKLVSESEANVKDKKISVTSPIGSGLLGKKIGEVAKVKTPAGYLEFEILNITI